MRPDHSKTSFLAYYVEPDFKYINKFRVLYGCLHRTSAPPPGCACCKFVPLTGIPIPTSKPPRVVPDSRLLVPQSYKGLRLLQVRTADRNTYSYLKASTGFRLATRQVFQLTCLSTIPFFYTLWMIHLHRPMRYSKDKDTILLKACKYIWLVTYYLLHL